MQRHSPGREEDHMKTQVDQEGDAAAREERFGTASKHQKQREKGLEGKEPLAPQEGTMPANTLISISSLQKFQRLF